MFITWTVELVKRVYTYIQIHLIVLINYVQFFFFTSLLEYLSFFEGEKISPLEATFFFSHLYWSIIALQCCVSFCFITK